VYTTYNPPGFNPLANTSEAFVQNAIVTISDGSTEYLLRDTTIERVDQSRYAGPIDAYVGFPLMPEPGKSYVLTVRSDRGVATGTAVVPGSGHIDPANSFVLKDPDRYREDITAVLTLSRSSIGYILRFYVEYEYMDAGGWTLKREEVPSSSVARSDGSVELIYPKLKRRDLTLLQPREAVRFSRQTYQVFLAQLVERYGESGFRLVSATFVLTQVEPNLYKYYNIVNGFQDEFSIRTDLPDYSSIRGGIGLFGAMTEDSAVVDLR
jgi:hypothetical protein